MERELKSIAFVCERKAVAQTMLISTIIGFSQFSVSN